MQKSTQAFTIFFNVKSHFTFNYPSFITFKFLLFQIEINASECLRNSLSSTIIFNMSLTFCKNSPAHIMCSKISAWGVFSNVLISFAISACVLKRKKWLDAEHDLEKITQNIDAIKQMVLVDSPWHCIYINVVVYNNLLKMYVCIFHALIK